MGIRIKDKTEKGDTEYPCYASIVEGGEVTAVVLFISYKTGTCIFATEKSCTETGHYTSNWGMEGMVLIPKGKTIEIDT